jgi:hypothetical protein
MCWQLERKSRKSFAADGPPEAKVGKQYDDPNEEHAGHGRTVKQQLRRTNIVFPGQSQPANFDRKYALCATSLRPIL